MTFSTTTVMNTTQVGDSYLAFMVATANNLAIQELKMRAERDKLMASLPQKLSNYSSPQGATGYSYGNFSSGNFTSGKISSGKLSLGSPKRVSTSDSQLSASFYSGSSESGVNRRVDTKCNKTAEELNKHLSGALAGKGAVFLEAERRYGVNAAFLVSICKLESGNGTKLCAKNNVGGMGGPGHWISYASVDDCILDIAKNISQGSYYFTQGKKTIASIGSTYCVGGNWANKVNNIMSSIV